MPLPKSIHQNLPNLLSKDSFLANNLATEVIDNLEKDKPVNWNLVLNKQLELETPKQATPDAAGN